MEPLTILAWLAVGAVALAVLYVLIAILAALYFGWKARSMYREMDASTASSARRHRRTTDRRGF